jgi:DNA-binding transcriptional ArsR family regulator
MREKNKSVVRASGLTVAYSWLRNANSNGGRSRLVKIARLTATVEPAVPEPDAPIEQWVRFYRDVLHFNVIPVKANSKQPVVLWEEFQKRKATDEQVEQWLKEGRFENIAVMCGETSGNLTVIDFDEMEGYHQAFDSAKLETETLVVRSGSQRGVHVYLRGDQPVKAARYEHLHPKFGIQGQGSIVIVPPSVHPSGMRYEIISKHLAPMEIAQIAESLTRLLGRLGVKDRKALSMRDVVKGVQEGSRETNMFRLAWYLMKIVKVDAATAWTELQNRNQQNMPPLPEEDLKRAFDAAKKAGKPEDLDEIEKTEFEEELEPGPEDYDLAKRILRSPHALRIIKILLDESIRREGRNKVYSFLVTLTAKHPNPKLKQILMLGGAPGGGKTTIANVLAKMLRTKRVGRYSEHAMDYSNLERYDLLYVQELLDLEQQKRMGVSTIRFLSADDQGYTVEFTTGDPKQGFTTKTRKIPAMTVITTTTVADTEAQFERRIHRVNVDESADTTKAVIEWKADEEKRAVFEWLGDVPARRGIYVLKAIVEQLQPYEVSTAAVSRTLGEILKTTHIRARGDYNKLLALTEMVAWLYQEQRPYVIRSGKDREERLIFALPQDAYYALEVGLQPILTMMTELDKRLRDLLPTIIELKDSQYTPRVKGKELEAILGFTTAQILPRAKQTLGLPGLSRSTIYRWLDIFEDKGVLAKSKAGGENVYSVISIPENEAETVFIANRGLATEISEKLRKEAETFFSGISSQLPQRMLSLTCQDWFDQDELDRDLTPLLEQAAEPETPFKVPLKERKDRIRQREMGGLSDDKSTGPAKGGS